MRSFCSFLGLVLVLLSIGNASGQSAGVPIYKEGNPSLEDAAIRKAALELRKSNSLLEMKSVLEQLTRTRCQLNLPPVSKAPLTASQRWELARKAHFRVGWLFKAPHSTLWQVNLAGGYAITKDGAVATCFHVAMPDPHEMKEAYLIAADDDDIVYPVTEVLAASVTSDSCILRIRKADLTPLPLSSEARPGDAAYCFSDPMGHRGFYSEGIINRFVQREVAPLKKSAKSKIESPVWLETSTDWAPGSSGAAVLDAFGNAIGHVSEIESVLEDQPEMPGKKQQQERLVLPGTVIIFHDAISARQVKALVEPSK
jgi:hypothetical protein